MRVAAYVHIRRTLTDLGPTGVGKHIAEGVLGLANHPDVQLQVLGCADDLVKGQLPPTSSLAGLPCTALNWKRRNLELAWNFLRWPKVEKWTGPIDWVYCPAEAYVARRRAKLAVVVHCNNWLEPELPWYNDPDIRAQRRAWRLRFRRLSRSTELILPVSEFLAGRLTTMFGIPSERMRVVGNGVEEVYFDPPPIGDQLRQKVGDRPYVVVVGGLTRRKGGPCVLDVARELHRRKSDLRILVAGVGEQQFDAPAAELPNVVALGYVGAETGLPALLKASVALFFPSRYETFGIPAVEAMAAGTPAVVSHYAALPEVVGDAGIIVDPAQPSAIADILDSLVRDAQLRAKYGEAGRRRAEEFHWTRCVERTYNALREFADR